MCCIIWLGIPFCSTVWRLGAETKTNRKSKLDFQKFIAWIYAFEIKEWNSEMPMKCVNCVTFSHLTQLSTCLRNSASPNEMCSSFEKQLPVSQSLHTTEMWLNGRMSVYFSLSFSFDFNRNYAFHATFNESSKNSPSVQLMATT